MDDSTSSRSPLSKLGKIKYIEWEKSMYGRLLSLGCSRIALGTEVAPTLVATDPASVTAVNAFNQCSDRAAGEIYQWLDEGNKIHVDAIRDNPAEMWKKLKSVHSKSAPNARFNSLSDLFNIRKKDDESLTDLATRVEGSMQRVKALRPIPTSTSTSPTPYTIDTLDEKLTIMAMIRALPREEYNSFISSVLLLTTLTKDAVLEAFRTEETQRRGAEEDVQIEAAAAAAAAARVMACYICDGAHAMRDCPQYAAVRNLGKAKGGPNTKSEKGTGRHGGRGSGRGANSAKADTKVEEGCDGPAAKADAATLAPLRI